MDWNVAGMMKHIWILLTSSSYTFVDVEKSVGVESSLREVFKAIIVGGEIPHCGMIIGMT